MTSIHTQSDAIVIRHASDADARILIDLALLDDRAPLSGPALIAEVDGVARAALDLHDGSVAADPFARTAELVELLKLHARGTRAANSTTLRDRVSLAPAAGLRPCIRRASSHSRRPAGRSSHDALRGPSPDPDRAACPGRCGGHGPRPPAASRRARKRPARAGVDLLVRAGQHGRPEQHRAAAARP